MSFLNSVMSSINGSDGKPPAKSLTSTTRKPASTSTAPTTNAVSTSSGPMNAADSLKRKADQRDGLQVQKVANPGALGSRPPTPSRSKTSSPAQRTGLAPPAKSSEPYRGTGRPSPQPTPSTSAVKPNAAAAARKPAIEQRSNAQPASSAKVNAPAAAKKGYLAILERAKAAQESATPFGQIKHQKTTEKERISRREKERQAAEAAAAAKKNGRVNLPSKAAPHGRPGTSSTTPGKSPAPAKKKIEVEYKGTMRAAPSKPAYTGTMRPGNGSAAAARGSSKHGRPPARPSYRYADDDELDNEEEEDEEENDYDSGSSDMEAGRDELDDEEMFSSRAAKREDEDALHEEQEMRRDKLERKRKLEALNAAAAKRKKVY